MSRWDYRIKHYAGRNHPTVRGPGCKLVLETVHRGDVSRDIEIAAACERMRRGEIAFIEVIYLVEPYGTEIITA